MAIGDPSRAPVAPEVPVAPSARFGYEPALDGLRGIAVLGVLLFHDWNVGGPTGWARGGFLGVDVFFVLSGFLITSLLLREWRTHERISYGSFIGRRVRRLLPAVILVLFGVALFSVYVAPKAQYDHIRRQAVATAFYVQNWNIIWHQGGLRDTLLPLNPTWSLAIEEQFYIVWPLALIGLMRALRGRVERLLPILAVAIAASIGIMAATYQNGDFQRASFGTDARAFEILAGAVVAVLFLWRGRPHSAPAVRALEAAGVVGAVIVLVSMHAAQVEKAFWYRGGTALFALACAFVVATAVMPGSRVLRPALSIAPLRYLGMISYGAYLVHWPIYVWLDRERVHLHGWPLTFVHLSVAIVVATASFVFVERPIRRGALNSWQLRVAIPVGLVLSLVAVFAATRG